MTADPTPAKTCPTCTGPVRETVGMVCQTCGTDYGPPDPTPAGLDLDAIEARADAASPGPWHREHTDPNPLHGCVAIGDYGWVCAGPNAPEYDQDSDQGHADAEFIAHARTDVPALVAEVRRAWSAVAIAQDWEQHGPREWDPAVIQGLLDNLDGLDDEHRQPGDRCRSATGDHLRALLGRVRQLDADRDWHREAWLAARSDGDGQAVERLTLRRERDEARAERDRYRNSLPVEVQDYWHWRTRAEKLDAENAALAARAVEAEGALAEMRVTASQLRQQMLETRGALPDWLAARDQQVAADALRKAAESTNCADDCELLRDLADELHPTTKEDTDA